MIFHVIDYPLKVSVDLTYQIGANGVSVVFEFRNHEAELTAHVSFGLHPGFGADFIRDLSSANAARIVPTLFFAGQFLVGRNARG